MEVAVFIVLFFAWAVVDAVKPKFFIDSLERIGSWLARMASPMFSFLAQAWARDRLAVAGVGSAVVAFLLWAWPESYEPGNFSRSLFFEAERLPAVAVFLALSLILLLLRRR